MLHCEGCGAPLAHAQAVCAACELAAAEPPGRYACPHCNACFKAPLRLPWPPNQRWYLPTRIRLQCPHCGQALRDRRQPRVSGKLILPLIGVGCAMQLLLEPRPRAWAGLLLLSGWVGYLAWRTERGFPDRERYAGDPDR
jgi:hypothetical protein